MGLKDEINKLRGELDQPGVDEAVSETVRKGAARVQDKVEEGLDQVGKRVREARAAIDDAADPDTIGTLRDTVSAVAGQVGAELERIPARYPTLTALAALGVGLAVGMSLGRKLR